MAPDFYFGKFCSFSAQIDGVDDFIFVYRASDDPQAVSRLRLVESEITITCSYETFRFPLVCNDICGVCGRADCRDQLRRSPRLSAGGVASARHRERFYSSYSAVIESAVDSPYAGRVHFDHQCADVEIRRRDIAMF